MSVGGHCEEALYDVVGPAVARELIQLRQQGHPHQLIEPLTPHSSAAGEDDLDEVRADAVTAQLTQVTRSSTGQRPWKGGGSDVNSGGSRCISAGSGAESEGGDEVP